MGDGEAFKTFIRDQMWYLAKGHDNQRTVAGAPIEDILYKMLRNPLMHEGRIALENAPVSDELITTTISKDGTAWGFTHLFMARLCELVQRAPENCYAAHLPEMEKMRQRRARRVTEL